MRAKYALVDADVRSLGLSLTGLILKRFLRLPRLSEMTSPTPLGGKREGELAHPSRFKKALT